jgi:hypothetical protein
MRKTEVYSWRVSLRTKTALEDEARRAGKSLGSLLDDLVSDWLATRRQVATDGTDEQARLQAAVSAAIGTIAGGDPSRATRARTLIRQRLARGRAR